MRVKSRPFNRAATVTLSAFVALGCAAAPDTLDSEHSRTDVVATAADLTLGSKGEDVRALHEHLRRYGYLPNAELAREYPRWRPIIAEDPAAEDVFDEQTRRAVEQLQLRAGLEVTGVVDESTRVLIDTPRCGVPDGIAHEDGLEDKFSLVSNSVGSTVKWRFVTPTDDNLSVDSVRSQLRDMFGRWSAETNLTFTEVLGGENIEIRFKNIDGPGRILAWADFSPDGTDDIVFDTSENWSTGLPFPNQTSFQTVALHEIGHTLGLGHSSISGSTMFPYDPGFVDTTLHADDKAAISIKYDNWTSRAGVTANDIGVGGDPNSSAWIISRIATSGGFTIHQWNGSSWTQASGGATRIAVDALGIPWVVNNQGAIFKRTTTAASTGSWQQIPGCALDIAAGWTTWAVGCDGNIWQLNNATNAWELRVTGGGATRVAVDRDNVLWFIWNSGEIFRLRFGQIQKMPGCALDIGAWNNVWVTGCSSVSGGRSVHVWNEQQPIFDYATDSNGNRIRCNAGACPSGLACDRATAQCFNPGPQDGAPSRFEWIRTSGGALSVAVGSRGPWLVNSSGTVFQQTKPGTAN